MAKKYNSISLRSDVYFMLCKLAESVAEPSASVVSNLIYQASQNEEEFINLFHNVKLARLGIKPPRPPQTPKQ